MEDYLSDGTHLRCTGPRLRMVGPMGHLDLQLDQVVELRNNWGVIHQHMAMIKEGDRVCVDLQLAHFVQVRLSDLRPFLTLSRYEPNQYLDRLTVRNTVINIAKNDFPILEQFLYMFP